MKKHIFTTRVRYADVDQMGVVYYANYLAFLESARTELLREAGYPYAAMEAEGVLLPVTECTVKYKGSARYDERITIESTIEYVRNASLKIKYRVVGEQGNLILTGHTIHPFINPEWKIISVPAAIRAALLPYVEP